MRAESVMRFVRGSTRKIDLGPSTQSERAPMANVKGVALRGNLMRAVILSERGSIRVTMFCAGWETQTEARPAATCSGPSNVPAFRIRTLSFLTTLPVAGLKRVTVISRWLTIHSEPNPKLIPTGDPMLNFAVTLAERVLMRVSLEKQRLEEQR